MYKKDFTLKEHLEMADDMALIQSLINKFYKRSNGRYPKSHPLSKILLAFIRDYIPKLQSRFDDEFHRLIDDQAWQNLNKNGEGHIYYNLNKRLSNNNDIHELS
jgi:hypothetical protein|tara:strand:+ start:285 stop:596 length:312 start_codon:yes stop_codon:yes gene_type:complete